MTNPSADSTMNQGNHPVNLPDGLLRELLNQSEYATLGTKAELVTMTATRLESITLQLYRAGADAELAEIKQTILKRSMAGTNSQHLVTRLEEIRRPPFVDDSEAADAARFRWMLDGHGYFMEEEGLCGHGPCSEEEARDARRTIDARRAIDQAMKRD